MRHSLVESATLRYVEGSPLECFSQWQPERNNGGSLLLVDFVLEQYWLSGAPTKPLTAIYYRDENGAVKVSVSDLSLSCTESSPKPQYAAWAVQCQFAQVSPGEPLHLLPTYIPKPWGQEVWLTGVEQRGVCAVAAGGGETPIPWIQAVMPGEMLGNCSAPLILLKILDPLAQPVVGDLYFELHEKKREVYVVTHVDAQAWPDATGYIRFGFAPDRRAFYPDDSSFRAAYLAAVRNYEKVRRELDASEEQGAAYSLELGAQEAQLRQEMDRFTFMKPLRVGDVVKVPLLMPHALQHGVRTIEFQTPVYERKILSFAQKVLTQDHWDTDAAVAQMHLDQPQADQFEVLTCEQGILVERIVDFSDFEVRRVRLTCDYAIRALDIEQYALLMVLEGRLGLAGDVYGPEQGLLLPCGWQGCLSTVEPATALVFLLALPRKEAVES